VYRKYTFALSSGLCLASGPFANVGGFRKAGSRLSGDDVRKAPDFGAAASYNRGMELDRARCYQAILSRDRRFDGRFFTGVVTTGIYCRPVCPVKPPKFENMKFYACAAAAEAAGFRPCKRCRPETAPGTPAWAGTSAVVSRAMRLIGEGGLDSGDLEGFAARLGIGDRQLRRLFAQHLGASPSDVARARRVHFARTLLDQTDLAISEVALSAGFASIRQFNHALKATFKDTPTALRGRRGTSRALRDCDPAGSILVRLPYRPPLAWDAMLGFLSHRAIPGVESIENGAYRRSVEAGGTAGVIEIRPGSLAGSGGTSSSKEAAQQSPRAPAARQSPRAPAAHDAAHLVMRVELSHCHDLIGVVERARRIFDLSADSSCIAEHLGRSTPLKPLVDALPGLRVPGAWDGFELAVRAILGQQVTVQGATTLAGRLVREFGTALANPSGSLTHLFPRPGDLAEADLGRIGLPRARAQAVRNLASAVAGGLAIDASLGAGGLEEAVATLTAIEGLGPWTAHYIAMRALAEPDAFPETDLGLRRALGDGDAPASASQVLALSEAWRPWRSYAAMLLWTAPAPAPQAMEKAS